MDARVIEIFDRVVSLPSAQRAAECERLCADEPALRAEVESLIGAHQGAGAFLDASPDAPDASTKLLNAIDERPGSMIGRYKLLQQIGEGGFGVVFLAEQEKPFRRRVALKIIKLGMDTREVIARFEAERQALAMMDHPNIARVLDAGATDAGRPYFVMELVKGEPVTKHCDKARLSVDERLDLFIQTCSAVQHAHQKGIIHRDLKPSNVLVTVADGKPVPKVIDFGIAKAMHGPLTEKTLFTDYRHLIGTPEYMSPEQAELSGVDIDTRSDIYSLGVLLYELLTGVTPIEGAKLRSNTFAEMQRIIREVDAPRPSLRLSTVEEPDEIARRRRTEPTRLSLDLRGDLDWIVLKALEKDRSRRYETASALALDIERFQRDQPVSASPPSRTYQIRKFVKRNAPFVALGGAGVLTLLLGIAGTTWGMLWAIRERDLARLAEQRSTAQAREASGALGEIALRLTEAGDAPSAPPPALIPDGRDGVEVQALADATRRIVDSLLESRRETARQAEEARRAGERAKDEAAWASEIAAVLSLPLKSREMERRYAAKSEARLLRLRTELGADNPEVVRQEALEAIRVWNGAQLASTAGVIDQELRADAERAARTIERAYDKLWTTLAADDPLRASLVNAKTQIAITRGETGSRVAPYYDQIIESMMAMYGPGYDAVYNVMVQKIHMLAIGGSREEVEAALRDYVERRAQSTVTPSALLDARHETLRSALEQVGIARDLYEKFLDVYLSDAKSLYDPGEPARFAATRTYARWLWTTKQYGRAEPLYEEMRQFLALSPLTDPSELPITLLRLGVIKVRNARPAEAITPLREALDRTIASNGNEHYSTQRVRGWLGEALAAIGEFEEAEELLLASLDKLRREDADPGADGAELREEHERAFDRFIALYEAWSKPDKAEAWRRDKKAEFGQ